MQRFDAPAWLLVLAGWLTADAALAVRSRAGSPAYAPVGAAAPVPAHGAGTGAPAGVQGDPGTDRSARDAAAFLARASPRELRQLPGLGELRANAYARERWRRGHGAGPPPLEDIAGIGPTIAARVARALAERARVRRR